MFIALLFFPTLALTINPKSAQTPLSQIKNNLDHFRKFRHGRGREWEEAGEGLGRGREAGERAGPSRR